MNIINNTVLYTMILAFLALSCSSSSTNTTNPVGTSKLEVNLENLPTLGDNFQYEGWIKVGTEVVSTGVMTNPTRQQTFDVDATKLNSATEFIVTIEPKPDTNKAASNTKVLSGMFATDKTATLSSHSVVAEFTATSTIGKYILETPSTVATDDGLNGVWFLDNSNTPAVAGLTLPTLTGWKYEGWVKFGNNVVSTGTFSSGTGADSDGAGPYEGTKTSGIPAFPGGDFVVSKTEAPSFLTFPMSLADATIIISVEPDPDNSPDPFVLKPLKSTTTTGKTADTLNTMTLNATAAEITLTGTATKK